MTLAEIIRAQLATGRPLRVTRALLEALDASDTDAAVMASLRVTAREYAARFPDLLYGTRTALCEALALPASTLGPAIVAAVVAIRETAKRDREERDEARRELSHRPTMIAHTAACRERDEARAEVERLRAERDEASESLRLSVAAWDAAGMRGRDAASVIREAEERGARWALATFFGPESSALVDRSRDAARICEAARKAGEHE